MYDLSIIIKRIFPYQVAIRSKTYIFVSVYMQYISIVKTNKTLQHVTCLRKQIYSDTKVDISLLSNNLVVTTRVRGQVVRHILTAAL